MAKRKIDFFWQSYSDLITSMFFIMLVLFILSFGMFQQTIKNLKEANDKLMVQNQQFKKIQEIEESLKGISDGKYFQYDSINKRHELKVPIIFDSWNANIENEYIGDLLQAGKRIKEIINKIETDKNVRYLIVIEGMASRGEIPLERWKKADIDSAYRLSYERALGLVKLWEDNNIKFDNELFEVVVAGSGLYGKGRYQIKQEAQNKRFLIQIIPKVGEFTKSEGPIASKRD